MLPINLTLPSVSTRRSGSGVFDPSSQPWFVPSPFSFASLRGSGKLWQDSAKTVPAVADEDPVRVAVCGTVDYAAPSDAARPLLFDEGEGKWSLSFDGVDDEMTGTVAWPGGVAVGSHILGIVAQTQNPNLAVMSLNGKDDWFAFGMDNYSYSFRSARADVLFTHAPFPPLLPLTYCQISGADYRVYTDNILRGTTAIAWETPVTVRLGYNGTGAGFFLGRMSGFTLAAAAWDESTREDVQEFTSALAP